MFQTTSGLENPPGYAFWFKKFKNDVEIDLKPTGFTLFQYHKLDMVRKMSLSYLFRFNGSNEGLEVKNVSTAVS